MPTLRPPAGFGILPELRGSPLPAAPIFRDQFTANFISLIASESLTQPPTRRVA